MLAAELVARGAVRSSWLRRAFEEVPRENFVPRFYRWVSGRGVLVDGTDRQHRDEWLLGVYSDDVLAVQLTSAPDMAGGTGVPTSSSSMPTVMAGMLEALDLQYGHRVLEIGTGTGYNAALLCQRVGPENVVTVELDPTLAQDARRRLAGIGLHPTVHVGDGAVGLGEIKPFDRIIATASSDHIPPAWITQLATGGSIVADLRGSLSGSIARLTATGSDVVEGHFLSLPGAFMPMRTRLTSPYRDGESWDRVTLDQRNPQCGKTTRNPALLAENQHLRFLAQLHLAGRRLRGFLGNGTEVAGHASDGSWCNVGLTPDDGQFPVKQGGPQRLWDTVEASYSSWHRLGEPRIDSFGVTAYDDAALQWVWFDHPDSAQRWPLPL